MLGDAFASKNTYEIMLIMRTSQIVKPYALQEGDIVAIVAPAGNIKAEYLERGIAEIEKLGFKAKYRPDIIAKDRYTAGSDERRIDELLDAFVSPEVKAIWCARGGYGTMRILRQLDKKLIYRHPKIFIGYSDITALHLYLQACFNWVVFHGPMATKDLAGGGEHYDQHTLLNAIMRPAPLGEIDAPGTSMLHGLPGTHGGGIASGKLIGGCLSMIVAMLGTPYEPDTRDSILFLEDLAVKPYAMDRMLQQLKLAGKFDGVKAIVFGEMTDCIQHPDQGYTIQDVLSECTAELRVPVMFGFPSGHSAIGNITLPLGVHASLDSQRCKLIIEESAVL